MGLFSTSDSSGKAASTPTFLSARSPDSANPNEKGVLVGHVIATKCVALRVTDESMDYPLGWQHGISRTETRGHREGGRTIAGKCSGSLGKLQNVNRDIFTPQRSRHV